jgi:hypothetical protein
MTRVEQRAVFFVSAAFLSSLLALGALKWWTR